MNFFLSETLSLSLLSFFLPLSLFFLSSSLCLSVEYWNEKSIQVDLSDDSSELDQNENELALGINIKLIVRKKRQRKRKDGEEERKKRQRKREWTGKGRKK